MWRYKGGGGGSSGGKNLVCYQLLPARPLRTRTAAQNTQQRPGECDYRTAPRVHTCTAFSDGVFPPEARLKHPISVFLVYLWH